jgi:dTDP-6-deoxy-L-talose 4-dehydrogenase (NAD+)
MTTIAVTGATGFIGRHVVSCLKAAGAGRIVASGRDRERLGQLGVDHVVYDTDSEEREPFRLFGNPDVLIHLAWQGLPNYHALFHLEDNLMSNYRFLKRMIEGGLSRLTVAGTCYEYGLQSGSLSEAASPAPVTSYAVAKDALRRFLERLVQHRAVRLSWARFFFLYGDGQHEKALIPQLEKAIAAGADSFPMSGGEQLRDYLPVEEAARLLAAVALQDGVDGIFNVCSGKPVSVRRLVEERVAARESSIRLDLGALPYPDYEPMAYWGDRTKLDAALSSCCPSFPGCEGGLQTA